MQRCRTTIVLSIVSLLAAMSFIGCGDSRCIRNSDCASHLECSAGFCVVPANDTEGGIAQDGASTARDADTIRDANTTRDAGTRDAGTSDARVPDSGFHDGAADDATADGAFGTKDT